MDMHLHRSRNRRRNTGSPTQGAIRIEAIIGFLAGILLVLGLLVILRQVVHQPSVSAQSEVATNKSVEASIILGERIQENGLKLIEVDEAPMTVAAKDGLSCAQLGGRFEKYIYFALDPSLKTSPHINAMVYVEFLAPVNGGFYLQYDGYKYGENSRSIYSDTALGILFDGWPHWHRVKLEMANARLQNRQNNGADFRLRVQCPVFYLRSVKLVNIEDVADASPGMLPMGVK